MKHKIAVFVLAFLTIGSVHADLFNFDLARNRGGVVFNASTDDSNLIWNTAAPAGSSWMTWNVVNTNFGNLFGVTISFDELNSSTGAASNFGLSIGPVNTDGYSDQPPRDGVWTSYMTTVAVNGTAPTVTLSGFSPGETVNLVLYTGSARWGGATTGEFTFEGVTQSYRQAGNAGDGFEPIEGETYVRFDGLVPDGDGVITGTFGALASDQEGMLVLAGLQFEVVRPPFRLEIRPAESSSTGFELEWESKAEKLYNLVTSFDLAVPRGEWELLASDIPATPPTNLFNVDSADSRRFYIVQEFDAPPPLPIFGSDFEEDNGGFTVITNTGSSWQWGAPNSSSLGGAINTGNNGSNNVWGSEIGNPGFYISPTVTVLSSPAIDLTGITGAELTFAEALDLDAGDVAQVFLVDANTGTTIGDALYTALDSDINNAPWAMVGPFDLSVGIGSEVRIEWRLSGQAPTSDYMGWYIDDVLVLKTTP